MFMMCEAMKWNHLPMAGGIYNQDPELMDKFFHLFSVRSEHQAKEAKKQEREAKAKKNRAGGARSSRPATRKRR